MSPATEKITAVANHYTRGDLLQTIENALDKMGLSPNTVTVEDLSPVDEFHVGGRQATENFMGQLGLKAGYRVLDVGCGLGGPARFAATRYGVRVSGVDLTEEYINTGNALNKWVSLGEQVNLEQGSALDLPYPGNNFDGAYMFHVGMNIEDKEELFRQVFRVLSPGAFFGVYDIMRTSDEEPTYPVPWAADIRTSHLATPSDYKKTLSDAGFTTSPENNLREFALAFFQGLKAKQEAAGGPPPLGLHTLMGESTPLKIKNMIECISTGIASPVEIIARKNG